MSRFRELFSFLFSDQAELKKLSDYIAERNALAKTLTGIDPISHPLEFQKKLNTDEIKAAMVTFTRNNYPEFIDRGV